MELSKCKNYAFYNEACELLSIKRDALRLLAEYKYCHSYPIHYCPSTYTFQILVDYAKFLTWNEKRKPKYYTTPI
jgi:hypothetical protein